MYFKRGQHNIVLILMGTRIQNLLYVNHSVYFNPAYDGYCNTNYNNYGRPGVESPS